MTETLARSPAPSPPRSKTRPGARSPARTLSVWSWILLPVVPVTACGGEHGSSNSVTLEADSLEAPAAANSHSTPELALAARNIVGFLRGEVPFDGIRTADTVTLYLAPEGGGTQRALPLAQLRDPDGWAVPAPGGQLYPFAPGPGLTRLTVRPGVHFRCMETSLRTLFPELGRLPHVGTMLAPENAGSCLETWNVTLIFAPGRDRPVLEAAVYDQWEW